MSSYFLLITAAFAAGVTNAVAGGGSFFTFPALVFTGVPAIAANASSTVALFPASFASAWTYRQYLQAFDSVSFKAVLSVSMVGGVAGALLLLYTPESTFEVVVPWLLLTATLIFIFGPRLAPKLQNVFQITPRTLLSSQFFVGIYAGYFGGAIGLIMLAMWSLFGLKDFRVMNANKTLIGGAMNGAAVVCFIIARKVWWLQTGVMVLGSLAGGYAGAHLGRRMDSGPIRIVVTITSIVMTVAFFLKNAGR